MIILDNAALSALAHIDKFDIPSKLFRDTYVPECVYYEGTLPALLRQTANPEHLPDSF